KLEDLIAQIPDECLRKAIASEVKVLKKTKHFGLVFEEHLPETVRMPRLPIRPGEQVALKRQTGNERWHVKSLQDGTAVCERATDNGQTSPATLEEFPITDLVVVRSFGEPIYPALLPLAHLARGGMDKPWQMVISAD